MGRHPRSRRPAGRRALAAVGIGLAVAGTLWALAGPGRRAAMDTATVAAPRLPGRGHFPGKLEYARTVLSPPAGHEPRWTPALPHWVFKDRRRDDVLRLLADAGLREQELAAWKARGGWREDAAGVSLDPPQDLVIALRPTDRRAIYEALGRFPENGNQAEPYPLSPDEIALKLDGAGLAPDVMADFRRLLYPRRRWLAFADGPLLAARFGEPTARRLAAALVRTPSYSVTVAPGDAGDPEALLPFWGAHPQAREARAALRAHAGEGRAARIPLAELLPPFARAHLNTYPAPSEAGRECFWTALNFFNATPDDRYSDPEHVMATLKDDFRPIGTRPPEFGDLVVMMDSRGTPVHVAIYVANDLVFTKNGQGPAQPWILMPLSSMTELYATMFATKDSLRTVIARQRTEKLHL